MKLTDAYTEFLLAHDYQPSTIRCYHDRLGAFMRWADAQGVTTVDGFTAPLVRRYVDGLKSQPSPKTGRLRDSYGLHSVTRSLLAWLNWLVAEDELDANVPARIKVPSREQKVLHVLDKRQIDRLFLTADTGPTNLRDRAILSVLLDTGLRANELCSLERRDVHLTPDDGYLLVRKGKGRRQREVPLGKKARLALHRYLRSHEHEAVFPGKGAAPLTPSGINQALYALYDRAGRQHFQGLKLGAHLYRHTFAVNYLAAGGDVYKLSRILGHSQITTTEGYLRAFTARQIREKSLSPLDVLGA